MKLVHIFPLAVSAFSTSAAVDRSATAADARPGLHTLFAVGDGFADPIDSCIAVAAELPGVNYRQWTPYYFSQY
jgi:hypothetical protein